jgi:hypothetical protein
MRMIDGLRAADFLNDYQPTSAGLFQLADYLSARRDRDSDLINCISIGARELLLIETEEAHAFEVDRLRREEERRQRAVVKRAAKAAAFRAYFADNNFVSIDVSALSDDDLLSFVESVVDREMAL